jgi:hypothetical protein
MATLGISTNTRLLALAIINRDTLVDYSIHLQKEAWSPSKATTIISKLEPCVRRYSIKNVVLSIPRPHHQTNEWKYLVSKLQAHCKTKRLTLRTKKVETLYRFCKPGEKKTKKAVMEGLCWRFPELNYCYYKELRNHHKYYNKLFEAIGVASLNEQPKQ